MRRWLRLGLVLVVGVPAALCGVSGLVGSMLDDRIDLMVEADLEAPPERVIDLLDDVEGLARWWGVAMDEYAKEHGDGARMDVVALPGPESGVGTRVDFVAGGVSAETWQILHVGPTRVVYDVDFKLMRVERTIALAPTETGTRVRWSETATIGNPWMRLMASAMGTEGAEANFRGALEALDRAATGSAGR